MFPTSPSRRTVIGWTAALTAGGGLIGAARAAPASDPFQLGVASGDPLPDGFVIWTRLAPQPLAADGLGGMTGAAEVRWQVAADEQMRNIVAAGVTNSEPNFANSVHIEVSGLSAARPYWYRFTSGAFSSPIGKAITAPARGATLERMKLVFASCSNYEMGYFSAYRHMAQENPDLSLFLGDYIYETSQAATNPMPRRHAQQAQITDLPNYRIRYAQYRTDPDLQALHAACPCLATWDDHEVQNDYSDQWSQNPGTSTQDFLARRAAAYQAFYEHMPLRRAQRPDGPNLNLYRRLSYGGLAEFTVLDGRQYRSEQPCPTSTSRAGHVVDPAVCTELADPNRTMLGTEQEAWLYQGFKEATAKWNVVAQDLLIAPIYHKAADGGWGRNTDSWEGYGANRDRMMQAIADAKLKNGIFLGGDIHSFWTTDLKADFNRPESATLATEFVGGSITTDGPAVGAYEPALPRTPFVRYFDGQHHGYVSMDLTAKETTANFQVVSDRTDPKATVSTLKSFVVADGQAGVQT